MIVGHDHQLLRGVMLLMLAVFLFSSMDTQAALMIAIGCLGGIGHCDAVSLLGMLVIVAAGLMGVDWKRMRRLTDATAQAPIP